MEVSGSLKHNPAVAVETVIIGVSVVVTPIKATFNVFGEVPTCEPHMVHRQNWRFGPAGGGAVASIVLHDIGGHVWIKCLSSPVRQVLLAPVKFVVTKGSHVENPCVVYIDGWYTLSSGSTIPQVRKQATLHFIPGIH